MTIANAIDLHSEASFTGRGLSRRAAVVNGGAPQCRIPQQRPQTLAQVSRFLTEGCDSPRTRPRDTKNGINQVQRWGVHCGRRCPFFFSFFWPPTRWQIFRNGLWSSRDGERVGGRCVYLRECKTAKITGEAAGQGSPQANSAPNTNGDNKTMCNTPQHVANRKPNHVGFQFAANPKP